MTTPRAPDWARPFLEEVSRPRLPGSDAVRDVERAITARLETLGLTVRRQEFPTSARRLVAVSIGAAGAGWTALLTSPLLLTDVRPWIAALVLYAALAVVGVIAYGLAEGHLPLNLRVVPAANLVATRGGGEDPRWWLVAHLDSKAQGVSLRGRVLAGVAMSVGVTGLAAAAALHLLVPVGAVALPFVVLTAGGAAAMSLHPVRAEAPGAVDNASGMLAVLAAAEALAAQPTVGVLITDAEEFGMEGARAWVRAGGGGEGFVNFDGLDDRGAFNLMPHAPRTQPARAAVLIEDVAARLAATQRPVRRSRLPLGVFVDGGVLVQSDLPGVTVSHGDWTTLGVVHTARDTADRLSGDAAWAAGCAVADALRARLVDSPSDPA